MLTFSKKFTLSTAALLGLSVILLIVSFFMPREFSFENHFLENLEVVVLLAGFILALGKSGSRRPARRFYSGAGQNAVYRALRQHQILYRIQHHLSFDGYARTELGQSVLSCRHGR